MGVMAGTLVTIIALVYIFIQPIKSECCKMKMAGGKTYKYEKMGDTSDFGCMDKCIYSESGNSGIDYCFKEGGDTMVQCMDMDNQGNTDKPQGEEGSLTKPMPKPTGSETTSSSEPMQGRTCPSRTMISRCNINCCKTTTTGGGTSTTCGPDPSKTCPNADLTNTWSVISGANSIFAITWKIKEGSKGDTCKLKCPNEPLDVTATCDLIGGKMQWTMPKELQDKCGAPPN